MGCHQRTFTARENRVTQERRNLTLVNPKHEGRGMIANVLTTKEGWCKNEGTLAQEVVTKKKSFGANKDNYLGKNPWKGL